MSDNASPTGGPTSANDNQPRLPFSWLNPHPVFVIILVGSEEKPFGIQKDFLCDRSKYYNDVFAENRPEDTVEHVVKLPDTSPEVFGLAQHFLYTGYVMANTDNPPSYESLVGLWKLGHKLGVEDLCSVTLDAMIECRRITGRIPATPLLVQVWRDTPEGSSIRVLLLSWAAEYMRFSDARAEFAKSLPQEVLSELVVTMSSFDTAAPIRSPTGATSPVRTAHVPLGPQKNVHYLDDAGDDAKLDSKRNKRLSSHAAVRSQDSTSLSRKASRTSLPKAQRRRSGATAIDPRDFTSAQKLEFCSDLLTRMLSGPGFWTRLVGPFREPVEPVEDGVPDYFDKVKKPMDLSTVKTKMDRKEYKTDEEFLTDVRQIFENCFNYWKEGDPMWLAGEKLQRTFEEKYSHMNKWIAKMGGDED